MRSFLILFILLALAACSSEQEKAPASAESDSVPVLSGNSVPSKTILTSNIEYLRLRSVPGPQGDILDNLERGASLEYLGEMSSFNTEVTLRGITFKEPWIKVKTTSGTEGWVFAGALNFKLDNSSSLPEQLMDIRLKSLFGESLAASMKDYRKGYVSAKTDLELGTQYENVNSLKEQAANKMESFIRVGNSQEVPDLFWLEEAMPAIQPQLVAEGTAYDLFHDYASWRSRASKTSGKEDDVFFDLCIALYSLDSIEYYWPVYFLQTWDYGGHSELGAGKHEMLLRKMDETIRSAPSFAPQIEEMKHALVEDILGPNVTYWNKQEAILQEMDSILLDPPAILTESDLIALKQRKKQFEDPAANALSLNNRDIPQEG
ncbi:MAG: SH3 domain-containing protein [Bacteroidetes bacterium]|nr:SH3 domain-containing protein [Bacteroidota bacterium]